MSLKPWREIAKIHKDVLEISRGAGLLQLMGTWTAILSASLETGHKGEQFGMDQFFE